MQFYTKIDIKDDFLLHFVFSLQKKKRYNLNINICETLYLQQKIICNWPIITKFFIPIDFLSLLFSFTLQQINIFNYSNEYYCIKLHFVKKCKKIIKSKAIFSLFIIASPVADQTTDQVKLYQIVLATNYDDDEQWQLVV